MQHGQDNLVATICVLAGTAVACAMAAVASRAANKHRNRQEALARLQDYSDSEFRRRYRMSRERFNSIAEIIRPITNMEPRADTVAAFIRRAEQESGGKQLCERAQSERGIKAPCNMNSKSGCGHIHWDSTCTCV